MLIMNKEYVNIPIFFCKIIANESGIKQMNLRYIRDEHDLKQKDIANILGIAVSTYCVWETETSIIPLNRLIDFCNYFDVSLDYALNFTTEKKYPYMHKNINYEEHCRRIKRLRKLNRYTQEYIAKVLNTDNGVISRYESGKTLILTSFLMEYAKIFNVSCDYIMGRIDEAIPLKKEKDSLV